MVGWPPAPPPSVIGGVCKGGEEPWLAQKEEIEQMKASETLKAVVHVGGSMESASPVVYCGKILKNPVEKYRGKILKVQRKLDPKRGSDVSRRNPTPSPSGSVSQGRGGFIFLSRISCPLHL